jgi:hypothetical protein
VKGLALATIGLWVILQTTFGPLATKIGLLSAGPGSPATAGPGPTGGQGNPNGISVWQPTAPPAGAPSGNYRVDQNGNYEVQVGGQWQPYTPGSGANPPFASSPGSGIGTLV